MDMAIGRFPVKNQEEAMAMVNKVIRYETNNSATNSACFNCNTKILQIPLEPSGLDL